MPNPIIKAKNLGEITASELESIGIIHLEDLKELGWESACIKYSEHYPERINLNAFTAIIGAIEDVHWQRVDPLLKSQAKALIAKIKKGHY